MNARQRVHYMRKHADAIATVIRDPWPADADFAPFFRQEANMPDPTPDPLAYNAHGVQRFADSHRTPDVLGDAASKDATVTLPSSVLRHERDENGHTTYLKLG